MCLFQELFQLIVMIVILTLYAGMTNQRTDTDVCARQVTKETARDVFLETAGIPTFVTSTLDVNKTATATMFVLVIPDTEVRYYFVFFNKNRLPV